MRRYCFDTNVWIDAWVNRYPPETFASLWSHLDRMVEDGTILCPEDVLNDLEKKEDELYRWARAHSRLFYTVDDALQRALSDIMERYPGIVDPKRGKSQSDPWVIALARITDRTVVTGEKASGNLQKPKIPDVCQRYEIPCISLLDLIREQKWVF